MTVRYFSGDIIRRPDQVREGYVWTSKGLRFEGGQWVPYHKRSNALDRDWTPAEDRKLKAYFAAVYAGEDKRTVKEFAAELGRSPGACHARAGKKLGILQQREVKGGFCTTPKWTDEEHALLEEWYPKVAIGEVVKLLPGRSKSSVFVRANQRGLVSPYAQKYRGWTREEQLALRIAYKRGIAITDIAFAVGRNPLTASKYATNHGFDFGRRPLLAENPSLELILSLEDESVPIPPLLSRVAMQPSRLAKRRPVVTNDKELRRRERETLAARRKQRRLEHLEERRRQQRDAKARKAERAAKRQEELRRRQAQRAAARAAEVEERRRQQKEEREFARAQQAQERRDRSTTIAKARRKQASRRRLMERAEKLVAAGVTSIGHGSTDLRAAVKIVRGLQENRAREQDPIEQAKLTLQRRGKVVHSMAVWGGRKDRFFVTGLGRDVTAEQLLEAASRMAA